MGNTSPYRVRTLSPALKANNRSKKARQVKEVEFKFFNQLPEALQAAVSNSLPVAKDAAHLACSSRGMNILLQHPPAVPMTVRKFLHHVVRGEHAQMQNMLRANINLLCQRGIVTDSSGREFGSISGFEYALWALDKFQWDDMLACLPRDNTGHLTEEGQKIATQLQQQYVHVKTRGVTYRFNGVTKTESHYDFAIINALKEQVATQTAPGEKNWTNIDKQWREGVGGSQRLCPMHVVDEYCSDTSFDPVPQFDSRPRLASGLRQFYNYLSSSWEFWFAAHSKLGSDFAIGKGPRAPGAGGRQWGRGRAGHDLAAMSALCETRTLDFSLLEAQLESSMMVVEERPRAGL